MSQPGDRHEREADRIADEVMRRPARDPSTDAVAASCVDCDGELARQAAETEAEPAAQETDVPIADEIEEDDDIVADETGMPKLRNGADTAARSMPMPAHRGGGQPLEAGVRGFMEERFGYDFGHVQIHDDAAAAASAGRLDAHAYTIGRDVYFNRGQYDPGTHAGRRLIAHELTHVIQQSGPRRSGEVGAQRQARRGTARRRSSCTTTCAPGACPQGKQSRTVRDDCATGEPLNKDNYISALHVSLADKTVNVIWSGMVPGNTETWPCSPNPTATPRHSSEAPEKVGKKCSINHTNRHKDGMAWLTAFASTNIAIGFHDSQPVGSGCVSHGCVRVCCDKAEIINKNTWSGVTSIIVT